MIGKHQSPIKDAIMQRVQAKAVSWIHSLLRITCPGDDVAGNEQLGNSQAGDAAFIIVGSEHGGPKEMLIYSYAHHVRKKLKY